MTEHDFLWGYLAISVLVALRMAWHICFQLDGYDRQYLGAWKLLIWHAALWPFHLFSPRKLIAPDLLAAFPGAVDAARRQRELDRLECQLPPCRARIRYVQKVKRGFSRGTGSQFVFDAADMEAFVTDHLDELPKEYRRRYLRILDWLRQRGAENDAPSDLPDPWNEAFLEVAVGLLDQKAGEVFCADCSKVIPWADITLEQDNPSVIKTSGWAFIAWRCAQRHALMIRDEIHILVGR